MTDAASPSDVSSATVGQNPQPSSEFSSQLGQWLENTSEIAAILPVVTGLLVTSRLQLRGAQALLVNLTIAALVRQAIQQLKKQAKPNSENDQQVLPASEEQSNQEEEDYKIVHSVPGRIRLRIPRLMNDMLYAKRLEKLLSAESKVKHVRTNPAAASLIIQYDGEGMSELELGMYLLNILDQANSTNLDGQSDRDSESERNK
ncbi:MAG: hypothetical protein J7545_02635 [Roseofilum sp. SBFL]|uniref:HMA2 domain-containing protein n=1 Tax=unclassified Roseofilum TaxID=2620099 RepID=UPI001B1E5171|nr:MULTISPECIES: hypothetical protein [unclassified Roseofilum]MBP0013268.1 hypothetical protein [Roseofilum sp. SID3]MBP0026386.1 hypothetical protein [Roseofilum sp. SID2]MBP0038217.1 hypothetical protein [Roseofilum sp. SID1]MBP0040862.1 hypothetical protein [Roseofilum sp. SBFL]